MNIIDLRSDSVTKPTAAMRRAMAEAELGDDVYGEDPTVNRLETLAAQMVGKEAALFVPSGSMGNQLAIMTHCERGDTVICDALAHIYQDEMAAASVLSGVQLQPVANLHGCQGLGKLRDCLRTTTPYSSPPKLVCLENTLNRDGGTVIPPEKMAVVYRLAQKYGLKVHLDGARIFNAAIALQCEVTELTCYTDSVMFCLSKGLGAPIGSLLAGPQSFIDQARYYRKLLGGGMRQAGVIAAAGIIALQNYEQLAADHEKAQYLAKELSAVEGLVIDLAKVQTNMVLVTPEKMSLNEFLQKFHAAGVLAGALDPNTVRFVTHKDVSPAQIKEAVGIIKEIMQE